jgi:putative transposase
MKIEYNNLYTHFVFVTEKRIKFITSQQRERIEKYITGIVNHNKCKLYAIYANPEHLHLLISRSPTLSEEYIATIVANSSARFINENKLCPGLFAWQQSASAFSVSKKDIDQICHYILHQEEHHRIKTFEEEYNDFLHEYQRTLRPE